MSEFDRNWEWLLSFLTQSNFSLKEHRGSRGFTVSGSGLGYDNSRVQVSMTPAQWTSCVNMIGDMFVAREMVGEALLKAFAEGNGYLVYENYGLEPSHEPPWERSS